MDQLIAVDAMHRLNCIDESGPNPCTFQNNFTKTNETKLNETMCIDTCMNVCICVCMYLWVHMGTYVCVCALVLG